MLLKLLLLIVLVVAVWFGFRWVQRVQRAVAWQERQKMDQRRAASRQPEPASLEAEDMRACPVCGTYVAASGATRCGRGNCPYP